MNINEAQKKLNETLFGYLDIEEKKKIIDSITENDINLNDITFYDPIAFDLKINPLEFFYNTGTKHLSDEAKYLIKLGYNINTNDNERNNTILHLSIIHNDLETVNYLLEQNANPFIYNLYKDNAIKLLIERSMLEPLKKAIDLNKDQINKLNEFDKERILTGLMYVKEYDEFVNIVETLQCLNLDYFQPLNVESGYNNLAIACLSRKYFEHTHFLIDNFYNTKSECDYQSTNTLQQIFEDINFFVLDDDVLTAKQEFELEQLKSLSISMINKGANPYIKNKHDEQAIDYLVGEPENELFRNSLISTYEKNIIDKSMNLNSTIKHSKKRI